MATDDDDDRKGKESKGISQQRKAKQRNAKQKQPSTAKQRRAKESKLHQAELKEAAFALEFRQVLKLLSREAMCTQRSQRHKHTTTHRSKHLNTDIEA